MTAERAALRIRAAVEGDLPAIVRLFAIPGEGNRRDEHPEPELEPCYRHAFAAISQNPNALLIVADIDGAVAGVFQIDFIQHFGYRGGVVAQIENVIIDPIFRGRKLGETMMRWAIDEARRRGAYRVQLTSNKARLRAHGFYERLGFHRSHEGFKLLLDEGAPSPAK